MAHDEPPTDCKECRRHVVTIAAAVVCLAGFLVVLKVDDDVIVVDDKIEPVLPTKFAGLVLARGGSKGLPRKNLAQVNGRTLLARAISAMQRSQCFDELWVSTDDKEIAEEALRAEANVHERPDVLALDETPSMDAVLEFVERHPDVKMVGLVQCTSPFIRPSWLGTACLMMNSQDYSSVFSVTRNKDLRWEEADENGTVREANFDALKRPRRQDWAGELVETGMFYFATSELIKQNKLQGGRVGYVQVPHNHSMEIDSDLDLVMAQALAPILDPSLDNPD